MENKIGAEQLDALRANLRQLKGTLQNQREKAQNELFDNFLQEIMKIDLKDDGSFRMNMKFFEYATGLTMVNSNFEKLFKNNINYNKENIPLEEKHYSSVDDEDRYFLSGRNTEGWTNSLISLLGITKTTSSYSGAFLDRTSYGLIAGVGLARVSLTEKTYSNSGRYEEEFVYSVDRNGSYDENIKLP